jgi:glucose 1-dehydrogenase
MTEGPLKGQIALVTGAASGIGAGVARSLGSAGAAVAINYVTNPEAAEAVAGEVQSLGGKALTLKADVSSEEQVGEMVRALYAAWGTIDILVNNAGLQKDAAFTEMTLSQWNTVIGVNLTGMFLCAREATREMVRRGVRADVSRAAGKIICMSSVHEVIPWAGHVNYASSKGGVHAFMQSLAQEMAPHRIRVNSIAPGAIMTPINQSAWETPEARASLLTLIPYGRIGVPEDIGKVAVFLASDEAPVSGPVTRRAGRDWWPSSFSRAAASHADRAREPLAGIPWRGGWSRSLHGVGVPFRRVPLPSRLSGGSGHS